MTTYSETNSHVHTHACTHSHRHEHKAKVVVLITIAATVAEIGMGYVTNSMALVSEGWHMSSHVLVMGLSWIAYRFTHKHKDNSNFKNGTQKILSLSGYTSAVILLIVALMLGYESILRFFTSESIEFKEALIVAIVGAVINGVSAIILHHKEEHSDHNIKSAYLHVLADAFTSVITIGALLVGLFFSVTRADAVCGLISAIVIIKWAYDLIKASGKDLLDYTA